VDAVLATMTTVRIRHLPVIEDNELKAMLPLCGTVLIACALAPETKGLIDARRLALMKPGAGRIRAASRAPIRGTCRPRSVRPS
jgi:phosphoglycerate dehydrogenase-like enzyme